MASMRAVCLGVWSTAAASSLSGKTFMGPDCAPSQSPLLGASSPPCLSSVAGKVPCVMRRDPSSSLREPLMELDNVASCQWCRPPCSKLMLIKCSCARMLATPLGVSTAILCSRASTAWLSSLSGLERGG